MRFYLCKCVLTLSAVFVSQDVSGLLVSSGCCLLIQCDGGLDTRSHAETLLITLSQTHQSTAVLHTHVINTINLCIRQKHIIIIEYEDMKMGGVLPLAQPPS